jgi:hypothetical protein
MSDQLKHLFQLLREAAHWNLPAEEIEQLAENFTNSIASYYFGSVGSQSKVIEGIKRMSSFTEVLLTAVNKGFKKTLTNANSIYDTLEKIHNFQEKYPPYVSFSDSEVCKRFFGKLRRDEYSYTEASTLLRKEGLTYTRQTVSKYHKLGKFGSYKSKGKDKITKEGLYNFYRDWVNNNR